MKESLKRNFSKGLNEVLFQILRLRALRKKYIKSNYVYVIRFAHIGDFCLWIDSAKEFKKIFPKHKIVFLTYKYKNVKKIAETTGYFDKVICFDTEGLKRIRTIQKACHLKGDIVINSNPSRSLLSDLFVLAIRTNKRIAQKSDFSEMGKKQLSRSDLIYDKVIECDLKQMELIKNAEFIRGLGEKEFKARLPQLPKIPCNVKLPKGKYAIIFPDADAPIQMWNYKNFSIVIQNMLNESIDECLILGSVKYRNVGDQIVKELECKMLAEDKKLNHRCINRMGETSLEECIELVRYASIVLSNDTGGAHIAAACNTPCVVLAAGWNRGRFFPYKVEEKRIGECMPVDIVSAQPCLGCGIENINRFNPECGINGVPKCIAMNGTEEIIKKIKEGLKK